MKLITKQDKNLTIKITYNNNPSKESIKLYAKKLKQIIDTKMIAS